MIDWLVALQRPLAFPKYRLLSPLIPSTGTRRARVFGSLLDLDLSDIMQRQIFIGCYERDETTVFRRILRRGNTLVDVGANVGYFTALGASLVGKTGKVFSIEPNPSVFAKLKTMVESSSCSQCSIHNIGLSDQAGNLTLYEPPYESHNLNSTMVAAEGFKPISVAVRTLDDLLTEHQVQHVDLLKVDVEGHEPKVFAGGARYLASGQVRHILCEFNRPWLNQSRSSPEDLLRLLHGFGFRIIEGLDVEADLERKSIVNLLLAHS